MYNLLSFRRMRKSGLKVMFPTAWNKRGVYLVQKSDELILEAYETSNDLYETIIITPSILTMNVKQTMDTSWHERLFHIDSETLRKSLPFVTSISNPKSDGMACKDWNISKQVRKTRKSYPESSVLSTARLELAYTELLMRFRNCR